MPEPRRSVPRARRPDLRTRRRSHMTRLRLLLVVTTYPPHELLTGEGRITRGSSTATEGAVRGTRQSVCRDARAAR